MITNIFINKDYSLLLSFLLILATSVCLLTSKKLRWITPYKFIPHGITGILSTFWGGTLIYKILNGNMFFATQTKIIFFELFVFLNAFSAFLMAYKSKNMYGKAFQTASLIQLISVYFCTRFLFEFPINIFDYVSVFFFLMLCIRILYYAFLQNYLLFFGALIGLFGLLIIALYPTHYVFYGNNWWNCIKETYPAQKKALIQLFYIPMQTSFGLILFIVTLWRRKYITNIQLGFLLLSIAFVTIIITIIKMETMLSGVSTQAIWIPCPIDNIKYKKIYDFFNINNLINRLGKNLGFKEYLVNY